MSRLHTWPRFMDNEKVHPWRYPHKTSVGAGAGLVNANYRRSPYRFIIKYVRSREVFCWLRDRSGIVRGALQFKEYHTPQPIHDDDFAYEMDADSSLGDEIANVAMHSWDCVAAEVLAYGPLIEFRNVWTDPTWGQGTLAWAKVAQTILDTEFSARSLLVMKAFPLDWEGRLDDEPEALPAFEKRKVAMIRFYRRLFDVQPFPSPYGDDGWLYEVAPEYQGLIALPSVVTHARSDD